jgi:hypothetical protein
MKKKTLHRHLHPVHWHGSMIVAIAALLITSLKCSGEMIRALQAVPVRAGVFDSLQMRDAETQHQPIVFTIGRHASVTSK